MQRIAAFALGVMLLFTAPPPSVLGQAEPTESVEGNAQFRVAAEHYARGRWELAAAEFSEFRSRFPQDRRLADSGFFLGEAQVQLARHREARTTFSEYLRQFPEHEYVRQAMFRAGETAYLAGQLSEAHGDLRAFLARYPNDSLAAYAYGYLGEVMLATGDVPAAVEAFEQALNRFPGGPLERESRFGLARALHRQGEEDRAIAQYEVVADSETPLAGEARLRAGQLNYAAGRHDDVIRLLRGFNTRADGHEFQFDAGYCLSMTYIAQSKWREAEAELRRIHQAAPKHRLAPAAEFYLGETLRQQGKLVEARREFAELRQRWPESPWAERALARQMLLALAAEQHAEIDQLVQEFTNPDRAHPTMREIGLLHARSLVRRRQFDEAVALLEPFLSTTTGDLETSDERSAEIPHVPSEADVRYYLAVAEVGRGRYEAALAIVSSLATESLTPKLQVGIAAVRGVSLLNLKRYSEAAVALRTSLSLEPEGEEAARTRGNLALALAQAGDWTAAREVFGEYQGRHADDEQLLAATLQLAEIAHAAGEHGWARELYQTVERNGAEDPQLAAQARAGLAWSQFEQGSKHESAETFERLIHDFPESPLVPQAALARGRTLEEAERREEALELYTMIGEKFTKSPEHADALLAAARVQGEMRQYEQAHATLQRIVREHPQLPRIDAVLYQDAWVLHDLRRTEQAEELFTKLYLEHKASPYWADATYRLAERAVRQRDYPRARKLAGEILEHEQAGEAAAHAHYLRGQLAASAGEWENSELEMSGLLDRFPDSSLRLNARYWVAESYYRRGMYREAGNQLESLAAEIEGSRESWFGMIPLRRAQVLAHQEDWTQAMEIAMSIAEQFPGFTQQYEVDYLLGRCHAARGEFQQARLAYQRVIDSPQGRSTETAAMAQWMIGESYLHQKDYGAALQAYHRTEILYRAFPRWRAAALLQAGKCYEGTGQRGLAAQQYARILQEFAETEFVEEAGRRLRNDSRQSADGRSRGEGR